MNDLLTIRSLVKRFGRTEVLRGVDLAVRAGEREAVIGPNGAGKSTLFHVVSGRYAPDAGEVWLDGRRIDGLRPHQIHRLGLARSFQISSLFPTLSVLDHLRCALLWQQGWRYTFWRRLSALTGLQARAQALLDRLHLSHQGQAPAAQLSYAEQRALELGLALASDAPVILLDEPTSGMSRSETQRFIDLIARETAGKTLLMIEHDMEVVFRLADRIAVMANGEVIAFDTPDRIRADARVRQAYLGQALDAAPDAAARPALAGEGA